MAWTRPLLLTVELMTLSVIFAAVVGISLAFALSLIRRDHSVGKAVFSFCLIGLVGCIATPLVLHAAAWEATAGKFGWMSFSQTSARTYSGLAGRYTGLVACVWVHGLFGSSIVALATLYGTSRVDQSIVDLSRLDGGTLWTWWRVRLPLAQGWVTTSLLATAVLAATEMTVVNLYGIRTLADQFYLFHISEPSLVSIFTVLVIPCVIGITLVSASIPGISKSFDARVVDHMPDRMTFDNEISRLTRLSAMTYSVLVSSLLFAFPLAGLLVKIGQQITVHQSSAGGGSVAEIKWSLGRAIEVAASALPKFAGEYQTTLLLACCTSLICVLSAWVLVSVCQTRQKLKLTLDLSSIAIFLIPGPLVGLILVRTFTLPIPGFAVLYQQTLLPTVVALSVRALPISYWVLRAAYRGIDATIADASQLDFSWGKRLWIIDRPLIQRGLIVAAIASAVSASGDVPAILPVIPPGVVTVGTRLFALLHSGARYQEASLAFWYVLIVIFVAIVLSGRIWGRTIERSTPSYVD